jgi:S1-C subfamily serine protease
VRTHNSQVQRIFLSAPLCAILLGFFFNSKTLANDAQNVARLKPSIIFIEATITEPSGKITTETGTGFIISSLGYALTANHLLADSSAKITATVGSRFGIKLPLYICNASGLMDATLVQLPDSAGPYQPVRFGDPHDLSAGDHLVAIGFPLDSDVSVSTGALGNKSGPHGLWQVSIALNYGNSGGPVLDTAGGVIGMVRGGVSQAQQINFMLPLNLLVPLLSSALVKWPPYESKTAEPPLISIPGPTTSKGRNCHEVVVTAMGFPPTYTKRTECDD